MLAPRTVRLPEPAIPAGITGKELDKAVREQLRTLSKENASGVAAHIVAAGVLMDTDLDAALAHAETAVRRAGRVAAAREALGLVSYRLGDWTRALAEFRTARRLSGSPHLLPYLVDLERALGRPERALTLAQSPEANRLSAVDKAELGIVVSGIRRDLGQLDSAVLGLRESAHRTPATAQVAARVYYAYADALLDSGDQAGARHWFAQAASSDADGDTDAEDRLAELDGVEVLDLLTQEERGEESPP